MAEIIGQHVDTARLRTCEPGIGGSGAARGTACGAVINLAAPINTDGIFTPPAASYPDVNADYLPSPNTFAAEQVEKYESSGGLEATTLRDRPVIILTTRGVQTGAVRKTPLMRVEHDGRYAVIGSAGGAPKDPAWTRNIAADPMVTLQDGPTVRHYRAHLATGPERETWWGHAVEAFPPYAEYATRTDRVIPVFVLEPTGGA